MIYELRTYTAMPGKLRAVHDRFRNHALRLFEKHGMRNVGYWTIRYGGQNDQLLYMLGYDDIEHRERAWREFAQDSEWHQIVAETEKDGPIVQRVENKILAPTDYSPLN